MTRNALMFAALMALGSLGTVTAQAQPASQPMDHGDMQMQGGSAPADARDPHAYAGGTTLVSGPFARPGPRELQLADEENFYSVRLDRLERVKTDDAYATTYEGQAWFGTDANRLVLKAEGDRSGGKLHESRTELLGSRPVASYWDAQLGVRHDKGEGPSHNWLAFGVQGLAPYWFELDATAYVGGSGRTALRLAGEYELLLTQRLVLQPSAEVNFYGKSDPASGIGRGLSDATAGLRLRYEFSRQFAPYLGVEWAGKFGDTADLVRAAGETTRETRYVAGVRLWF